MLLRDVIEGEEEKKDFEIKEDGAELTEILKEAARANSSGMAANSIITSSHHSDN